MMMAEKYKKYYHGTVVWIPNFLKHKFQYCTMYFFDIAQGCTMIFNVWNTLPEDQRPKKIGIYFEQTYAGKQMADGWEKTAEKYGYEIALRASMGVRTNDFKSQVLKVRMRVWMRFYAFITCLKA
jgi:branched-chain amino acid transport system substrate-binding protein